MNYKEIKRKLNMIQKETEIQNIPRIITFRESEENNNIWIITEQYYNHCFKGTKKKIYTDNYQQYIDKYKDYIYRIFYDFNNRPVLIINSMKMGEG